MNLSINTINNLKLSAVVHKPEGDGPFPAVILLHGFTGYKDEEHIVILANDLAENGLVAVRFDASGFGESEGNTERDYRMSNHLENAESAYKFLIEQDYVDEKRVGVWGHSMGGGLAIIFASKHPEIRAVCSVSTSTSFMRPEKFLRLKEWKENGYFERESSRYGKIKIPYEFVEDASQWNQEELIKNVHTPILIALGKEDDVVLPENTRLLYEAANNPKELVEFDDVDHFYKKNPDLIRMVNKKIVEFFKKNL